MTACECLMFFVSTVYFGISAFFIYVSLWLLKTFHDINYKLDNPLTDADIILLSLSSFMLLLGIFGCFTTCYQSKSCIILFSVLTILALIVMLSGGIIGLVSSLQVRDDVNKSIYKAIDKYNDTGTHSDSALDLLQNKHQCCGAVNASDWINSTYWLLEYEDKENRTETHLLPHSCCVTKSEICKLDIGNFYTKGCSDLVIQKLKNYLKYSFAFCFGLAFIQITGIVISCGWFGTSNKRDVQSYMKVNRGTYA
ncbi:tetraspanin-3-like [Exaiptasia diaphana]|uniref:Tetraspanin n=1 Tax=Exaiptasia diaphana TaxID=2652724 RepID=A0A913X1I6_EXADI|nr:tetraspanin-3-like [Exaiptasia diaphana]